LFFAGTLRPATHPSREQVALGLAGMLLVACYFSFGLTEVIFWSVRSCIFYATMVFILVGFCLNARDAAGARAAAPGHAGTTG
jgi:O-antigen ligase